MRTVDEHLDVVLTGVAPLAPLELGILEARGCYRAICLLVSLLNGETEASFSVADREGMAVLLESIQGRFELSMHGLGMTAQALGMPDAWELVH